MTKIWSGKSWDEYIYWQEQDPKMVKRINALLKNAERTPFTGLGKPEPLKDNKSGWWSRRIDDVNRLVYRVNGENLEIAQCRGHY